MKTIKVKFHSVVDVITNSSTVIYTYQNSVTQAKDLVAEMLKLAGITDKNPDDIFYYGVFCEDYKYFDYFDEHEDDEYRLDQKPTDYVEYTDSKYGSPEREAWNKEREDWLDNLKLSIIKKEIDQPEWMTDAEDGGDYWDPSSYLTLIPKEPKYEEFGNKIKALLGSISADGGRDG